MSEDKPTIYNAPTIYNTGAGGGGGSYSIIQGKTFPTNDIGNDGDIYLLYENVGGNVENDIPKQLNNSNLIYSNEWTGDGGQAWHLFDQNNSTYWSTTISQNTDQYCGVDLVAPVVMKSGEIFPRVFSSHPQIQDFKIEGSNNLTDWDILYTGTIPDSSSIVSYKFSLINNTAYRYYRLYVLNTYVSQTITVYEMSLSVNDLDQKQLDHAYQKNNGVWDLLM